VRGQKNEFHALEKFYNYFPQSSIEEIDIAIRDDKTEYEPFMANYSAAALKAAC
jgi:predicted phosphoribosyltransferase